MFLSAIVKAHSDGLASELAKLPADSDDSAESATSADAEAKARAAERERRLIELPSSHRARWL